MLLKYYSYEMNFLSECAAMVLSAEEREWAGVHEMERERADYPLQLT